MAWAGEEQRQAPGCGALLRRLQVLGPSVQRTAGPGPNRPAAGLAGFCRFTRAGAERHEHRVEERPWLLAVLGGSAEVGRAPGPVRAEAGEALVLPARTRLELTLSPAAEAEFEALEVEFLAESLVRWLPGELAIDRALAAEQPALRRAGRSGLSALVGFCEALLEPETHPLLLQHKVAEVLLAVALESEADAEALDRARARLDLTLAVRQLVRAEPDFPWNVSRTAHRLGLSPATLRRRLAQRRTGLRRLVQEERMRLARTLLGDGRLNVGEVAFRCGYGSPAKFSRLFKQSFGVVPSHFRPDEH